MFKFLNLEPETFGLDINDLSLRIVKLRKRQRGLEVVSFNETKIKPGIIKEGVIQDEDSLVKTIRGALNTVVGEKLKTKYVIASLPEEKSFSQVIQMPDMTQEELKLAVPFEVENYIPLTIDKVYMDFQTIKIHKDNVKHMDLLINAMPKTIVNSYISCLKKADLVPYILEVESQAIVRSLVKNSDPTPPTIFIDFGQTKSSFLIYSENSIRFTSSITTSSQQLTNAICDTMSTSPEKAEELKMRLGLTRATDKNQDVSSIIIPILNDLAEQIKKYIGFYQGHVSHEYLSSSANSKIEKIVLCGGGSNLKAFPEFLSEKLKIPVQIGNPFVNLVSRRGIEYLIPKQMSLSFTSAIGLAQRAFNENNV